MALEAVLERLGLVLGRLGPSWAILDVSGEPVGSTSGRSYCILGASWAVLGMSWAGPGLSWSVLERLGGALGQIFLAKGS